MIDSAITTKRPILAQVLVCSGCCCGKTEKGKPPVPVDWLKAKWKEGALKKRVQLTISGCLGPCDIVNVVCVITPQRQLWLGGLTEHEHYEALADWAQAVLERDTLIALPDKLERFIFQRFMADTADVQAAAH